MWNAANGRRRGLLALILALAAGAAGCESPTRPPQPSPTPTPVVTVPALLAPANGASQSNDCTGDTWVFDWSDVPNASAYHLLVRREGAAEPLIDSTAIATSEFRWVREPSIVPEAERGGWRWRVRAMVDGNWRDWTAESAFAVDPLYPRALAPAAGAVLDNGCTSGVEPVDWDFRWSACSGASRYHLYVIGANASIPVVDDDRLRTPQLSTSGRGYIADANRRGWRWQMRARFADGWGPWSPEQTFDVEPVDTDCRR
jgi:hypothetical protein